jgi:hypothetical protein
VIRARRTALGRRSAALGMILAALAAPAASGATPPNRSVGIWVSPTELQQLPMKGPAWDALKNTADRRLKRAKIRNQNTDHDVRVLAAALVYARTGQQGYRNKAAAGIMAAIGTERKGRTLALARALLPYVLAADLIDLKHFDRGKARVFARWLRDVRREKLEPAANPTLVDTHELRPNNWGTLAGASRIAADAYLGDRRDLARAAAVFKGWLGDRAVYKGFVYNPDKSWQADAATPVGINPAGTTKDGRSVDGALPEEMRRGCGLQFPPCPTGYAWEALQGAVMQAELLYRRGYDSWSWEHKAVLRAARFLYGLQARYPEAQEWAPHGDDSWIPWIINARFRSHLSADTPSRPGKGMGFTDWVYQRSCRAAGCRTPRVRAAAVQPVTDPPKPLGRDMSDDVTHAGIAAAAVTMFAALGLLARHRARRGEH